MASVFQFGPFELDEASFELRKSGALMGVQPKVLDLLFYLLRHRDKVSLKEDLLAAVWPDVVVSDASLTRAVREIRRALDDDGDAQTVVQTIRGRGYRFIADVREASRDRAPAFSNAMPAAGPCFVGRDKELHALVAMLDLATRNRAPHIALLSGDAGTGRTRLLDELASAAKTRGARILRARFSKSDAASSHALRDLVRPLRDAGDEKTRELAERSYESLRTEAAPNAEDAMKDLLLRLGASSPLVILLDDVHRAPERAFEIGEASVRALHDTPALYVLSYVEGAAARDPRLARAIGDLNSPRTRAITLAPLSVDDVERLLEASGGPTDRRVVAALFEKTGGNPLLLSQLVNELSSVDLDESGPVALTRSVRLSSAVVEVMGRQLEPISAACQELLSLAAVFGIELALQPLAFVANASNERVLELLDEAIRARVLTKLPGYLGRYRFGSIILRDVLYKRLAEDARSRAHAACGEALLTVYRAEVELLVEEIATHLLQGAATGNAERAVEFALRAADSSKGARHWANAAWFLEGALGALAHVGGDAQRHVEIALDLGAAHAKMGDGPRARHAYLRAQVAARAAGDARAEDLATRALDSLPEVAIS